LNACQAAGRFEMFECLIREALSTLSIFLSLSLNLCLFSGNVSAQCATDVEEEKSSDIVDLAVSTEFLSTLVAAVKAGDLVETLKGDGLFTVFVVLYVDYI